MKPVSSADVQIVAIACCILVGFSIVLTWLLIEIRTRLDKVIELLENR